MKKLNTMVSKLVVLASMVLAIIATTLIFDTSRFCTDVAAKDITDNYVLSTIYEKIQVPRIENTNGTVTYQVYTRNLNIDLSSVDDSKLALSMKVYVKQIEGTRNSSWVLMDYGDMIIHIFDEENRLFYDLERIWRDGKILDAQEFLAEEE